VINCSSGRVIRQRRALYEALLQLEAQGVQLVERPLGGGGSSSTEARPDLVLTPSTCLMVYTQQMLQVGQLHHGRHCMASAVCPASCVLQIMISLHTRLFVVVGATARIGGSSLHHGAYHNHHR
jgi:hypothetical protein